MVKPCSVFLWGDQMQFYLIMCRSLTGAQRAAKLLERSLIRASVTKAPAQLTRGGCAYALRIYKKTEEAVGMLRRNEIAFGKVFLRDEDGGYREVQF